MTTLRISALSRQYVPVPVYSLLDPAADPTGDTVQMAFKQGETAPGPSDWLAASWTTIPAPDLSVRALHVALCLIGPGGGQITLAAGTWWPWVKVSDSPEAPVLRATAPFVVF